MKRPFAPLSSKRTTPVFSANSESSFARATFLPGLYARAALPDQNAPTGHDLPTEPLHPEPLSVRVASVYG